MKLFHKLLLTLLSASILLVVMMLVFVNWSFRAGFEDYLHQTELRKAQELIPTLALHYQRAETWDALKQQPHTWGTLIRTLQQEPLPPPPKNPATPQNTQRPLPLGLRLALWDAQQLFVIGDPLSQTPASGRTLTPLPIQLGTETVGWLVVRQGRAMVDDIAQTFMAQQRTHVLWIVLSAVLVATGLSWLLLQHLLQPIQNLTQATQQLAANQLDTRVTVSSHDELGQLAQHFNQMAATLKQHEQNRQQWLTDISHELRTPLAILSSETEAVLDGVRPLSMHAVESLYQEIQGLTHLVNDLHELAKADSGELVLVYEPVDLTQLLQQVCLSVQPLMQQAQLQLLPLVTTHHYWVKGDAQRLKQVWLNLFSNSQRYTHAGGQLALSLHSPNPQQIQILLDDSPPSVPAESLPYLFERLYRVDKARQRQGAGSGLGLTICQAIIQAHNGTIRAEHSPLGGLRMVVTLPLIEATL